MENLKKKFMSSNHKIMSSKVKKTKYIAFAKFSANSNNYLKHGPIISVIIFFGMVSSRVQVNLLSISRHKVMNFSFYAYMWII